jgi:Ni,Fe-hydrogenase I large subunit
MSHITHFFHLSALDYVDMQNPAGNPADMHPWTPQHTNADMIPWNTVMGSGNAVVLDYITALTARRDAHVMGARIDGKHPCQNAQVPGGMTTKPDAAVLAAFRGDLTSVTSFVNNIYINDIVTAATVFGLGAYSGFTKGVGCKKFLAYGCCPLSNYTDDPTAATQNDLLMRGVLDATAVTSATPAAFAVIPWDVNSIVEYTDYSRYHNSASPLSPKVGETTPDYAGDGVHAPYTWHKAPRYVVGTTIHVLEVGPLARMLVNTVREVLTVGSTPTVVSSGGLVASGTTYNVKGLVDATLTALGAAGRYDLLISVIGRHGARALETKYLCDAMGGDGGVGTGGWVEEAQTAIAAGYPADVVYTYKVMPKSLKMGIGLTEAPRGALGHWITTEARKVVSYQCVVPSTWNGSPLDAASGQNGAIEQALIGEDISGSGGPGTYDDTTINKILRLLHPFDICIACSVHLVTPKGKFKLELDVSGKPMGPLTKID